MRAGRWLENSRRIIPKHRAFTIIELLVVIAIIAVLAAILFPVMARARDAAKGSTAMSNVRQLAQAMQIYADAYDDRFCLAAYGDWSGYVLWHDMLDPFVGNKQIWLNPASQISTTDQTGAPTSHWGYNAGYLTNILPDFSNAQTHQAFRYGDITDTAATVLFVSAKSSVQNSWCGDEGKFILPPSWPDAHCWGRPEAVPNKMATIAWVDSHAKRASLGQFYSDQEPPDRFFDRD